MNFFAGVLAVMAIASCASPGEKSSGTYNGNYNVMGTDYPGKIVVTKSADNKVNMVLTCYYPVITDNADGVNVTANGDKVTFAYDNTGTTTPNDMASITGTLDGNTVVLDGILYLGGSSGYGVFTGTK